MDCSLTCPQHSELTACVQTIAVEYWGAPVHPGSTGDAQEGLEVSALLCMCIQTARLQHVWHVQHITPAMQVQNCPEAWLESLL